MPPPESLTAAINTRRGRNCVALVTPASETFIFFWDRDPKSMQKLMQTLGNLAADPDVDFTWYDAAVLSQKVRKLERGEA